MKLKLTILLIIMLVFIQPSTGAVIHGVVYNWENLKPLPKAVIIVNTTPEQKYVTPDGSYSFTLPTGHYVIKAYYYQSGKVVLYAEDNITIRKNGSYILDLILFPSLNVSMSQPNVEFPSVNEKTQSGVSIPNYVYAILILIFFSIIFTLVYVRNKKNRNKSNKEDIEIGTVMDTSSDADIGFELKPETYGEVFRESGETEKSGEIDIKEVESIKVDKSERIKKEIQLLPDDLREALEEIAKADGRITQKDLRKKLKYSEAKVSLILTDLERRGYIEKVKKGRGNVIFLKDEYRKVFRL